MSRFLIRCNCEYTLVVDADDEDSAITRAGETPYDEWEQAWSEDEAEPLDEPQE